MKRSSAALLRALIVLAGVLALAFLLWEPRIEGRNAHAGNLQIYFQDPFLAFAYLASLPFFAGLYHAFRGLGYAGEQRVSALRKIRHCALAVVGFVAVSLLFLPFGDKDDRPAGLFMRALIVVPAAVTAAAAAKLESASPMKGGEGR